MLTINGSNIDEILDRIKCYCGYKPCYFNEVIGLLRYRCGTTIYLSKLTFRLEGSMTKCPNNYYFDGHLRNIGKNQLTSEEYFQIKQFFNGG